MSFVMNIANCSLCSRWEEYPDLRIAEFEHSYLILNQDQYFPGYCLLLTKHHHTELFHLEKRVRQGLIEEISMAAEAIFNCYRPDKMNYELLGNMVPHIHWHLVPRFSTEPLWPRPIWSEPHIEEHLMPDEYTVRCEAIRQNLAGIQ